MKHIQTKEDLQFLVDTFYGKVMKDEVLSPHFQNIDMQAHQPIMVQFWAFALLDEFGYKGNVIEKHLHMPLKKEHFEHWVNLFEGTLDEHFEGEKVALAKQKIAVMRWTMESKILK